MFQTRACARDVRLCHDIVFPFPFSKSSFLFCLILLGQGTIKLVTLTNKFLSKKLHLNMGHNGLVSHNTPPPPSHRFLDLRAWVPGRVVMSEDWIIRILFGANSFHQEVSILHVCWQLHSSVMKLLPLSCFQPHPHNNGFVGSWFHR